jgi:hypothetical protein
VDVLYVGVEPEILLTEWTNKRGHVKAIDRLRIDSFPDDRALGDVAAAK